jgi:putative Mn2+ efflux pump MntP
MNFFEMIVTAFALAADAFAVSVAAGASGATTGRRSMLRLSFHFGLFQWMMPVIGWSVGLQVAYLFHLYGKWIAFILLAWVGGRMLQGGLKKEGPMRQKDPSRGALMLFLSFATSVDALAVGFSLALLNVSIWYPAFVIGCITGITSFIGVILGKKISASAGPLAECGGGVVLILIGLKMAFF